MLINISVVQTEDDGVYILFVAHHSIWDAASSELLRAYLGDETHYGKESAGYMREKTFSYADYCVKYYSQNEDYEFSNAEFLLFEKFISLSNMNIISASKSKFQPGISTLIHIALDQRKHDLFTNHPIETAILLIYYLLGFGNELCDEMMFNVLFHNRNEYSMDLMGLACDYQLYSYNCKTNAVYCHEVNSDIPLSEKMKIWLRRNARNLPPLFAVVINYLDMFTSSMELHDNNQAEYTIKNVKTENIAHLSEWLNINDISFTFSFRRGALAAGINNINANQSEIEKALDYAESRLLLMEEIKR